MPKEGKKSLLLGAVATLTGTAIGAGFLGIPHVISKSGFLIGLIHLIILALVIVIVNLYFGEVILRTKQEHQLPGYAQKYLGSWARVLMILSMIFGIYAALIAYFMGEGQVLSFIFTGSQNYAFIFSLIFFIIIAFLVYFGLEALKKGETIGLIIVSAIVLTIIVIFLPKISIANLAYTSNNPIEWFLPYGIILFSFLSFSALPEVKREIKGNEKMMKKAIIIGALIPLIAYVLFTIAVVGFAGKATPEIATIALGKIPSLLAVFTMFTACFALCNAIQDMYEIDMKMKRMSAWFLACIFPFILFLIIFFFKLATFTQILEVTGSIVGGLTGILIILMLIQAKKHGDRKPEYKMPITWLVEILIILLFIFGILFDFIF